MATSNTSLNTEGTYAKYECDYGYKYYSDNATSRVFMCGDNGWVPPPEECISEYTKIILR